MVRSLFVEMRIANKENKYIATYFQSLLLLFFKYMYRAFYIFFLNNQQKHNYNQFINYHAPCMFRHYRVIFRQLVFITSPSYISISVAAVGNTV